MGFLRRNGDGGNGDGGNGDRGGAVPDWAGFMDAAEYGQFRRLTDEWLRAHVGSFREIDGGGVELRTATGRPLVLGLTNLAQTCHRLPREEWAAQVDSHLGTMLSRVGTPREPDFEDARSMIKVRLYPENYAPTEEARKLLVSRPVAAGIQSVLVIDYPDSIGTVRAPLLEKWGRKADELFALGLANVRQQDVPDASLVGDGPIHLLSGNSFFVATWLLMLEKYLEPVPKKGALVIVPHRHALLFQPVVDVAIMNSVAPLLNIADMQFRQGPGSISPSLYWWKAGRVTLLPAELKDRQVRFAPTGEFMEVLNSLPAPKS
jgi:hypothetical protein